ncbi:hypothetical protein L1987_05032 [Smallanthus sonchifolius]|uniref:Uncharacterized protein n=1 Tax=Smallanthus sonchifolius TaxID=185202 RepID=A0ACB9JUI0_9ASTR|nr:hypothetical protein L1987_05032 [Smallanthus sonchifolius]
MSPSIGPVNGNLWQNKLVQLTPPALQLPGSRLKAALNARDLKMEIEFLQRQQMVDDLSTNLYNNNIFGVHLMGRWTEGSTVKMLISSGVRLLSLSKFNTFSKPSQSDIAGRYLHRQVPCSSAFLPISISYLAFAMSAKTVKVSNLSLKASQRDVKEFFSFSGDIVYVEVQSDDDCPQNAFVAFTDSQGAETAALLSGATIVDTTVTVTLAPDYLLPPEATSALPLRGGNTPANSEPESALRKAEDVVSSMLCIVTEKVKEVDQKHQVSEKAKSAFAAAEQTVSNAGSAIMKNRYVVTSASWVSSTVNKLVKTVSEFGQQTKEKAGKAENENKQKMVDDSGHVYLTESLKGSGPTEPKPAPVQGLSL